MDWSKCPDVESKPGVVSGAWVLKGTRVPADFVIDNANDGFSAEEIATEIYDTLSVEATRRVIAFAREHEPSDA